MILKVNIFLTKYENYQKKNLEAVNYLVNNAIKSFSIFNIPTVENSLAVRQPRQAASKKKELHTIT